MQAGGSPTVPFPAGPPQRRGLGRQPAEVREMSRYALEIWLR